jgi:hypothetical protein
VWLRQGNYEQQDANFKENKYKKMKDLKKKEVLFKNKTHVLKKEPQERALVNSPARW